jgi:hypothetical protein
MKRISFSINQLIIDDKIFELDFFRCVPDECKDPFIVSKEIRSIKVFKKNIFEDRFIGLYFKEGEKYPYSPKVIKSSSRNLEEIDNPKLPDEIELNDHFFALIDCRTQLIYASDQRRVIGLVDWIRGKTKHEVVIKPLFEERDFINKIKSVSEVSFTVIPNLFNKYDPQLLSAKLAEDIYGFGAEKATLSLKFGRNSKINEIKEKINQKLFNRKSDYEKLTIVGRVNDNFESIFNLDGIINKISVATNLDENTKNINELDLFESLINKIKQNEKTK